MRIDSTVPSIEDLRIFLLLGVAEAARRLEVADSVVSRRRLALREDQGQLRKQG